MQRRQFLKGAAAAGLLFGCNQSLVGALGTDGGGDGSSNGNTDGGTSRPQPDLAEAKPPMPPEDTPESAEFPLGISSGDVTAASAILWTRYQASKPLKLVVWEMQNDDYKREVASVDVMTSSGGFAHHDVPGLTPGSRYRYAFFEMNGADRVARSAVGKFRAAPDANALEPLVVGASSCTSASRDFLPLERAGERNDLDLFLLLGDTAYCDGANSLDDYRDKWHGTLSSPGYLGVRAAASVLATWDDHEVTNDFNPETIAASKLQAATDAYFEHLPLRRDPMAPSRLWKSTRWGKTLEVFTLDSRSERLPSTRSSAGAQYLSRAQMNWLKQGLAASDARFKLILNSVPISRFPWSQLAGTDSWSGYQAARTEILEHIEMTDIPGVVWLSGDHHFASMGRVSGSGAGSSALEILAGPGGQSANPAWTTLSGAQWDWASGTNNYTALHFDPMTTQMRVVFHDKDGQVLTEKTYNL
jgi:alkaline phosphatase D